MKSNFDKQQEEFISDLTGDAITFIPEILFSLFSDEKQQEILDMYFEECYEIIEGRSVEVKEMVSKEIERLRNKKEK